MTIFEEEADQFLGMSMTYSLFEWVRESLDTLLTNQPETLQTVCDDLETKLTVDGGMVQTWSLCNVHCAGYLSHITAIAELVLDTGEESPGRIVPAAPWPAPPCKQLY